MPNSVADENALRRLELKSVGLLVHSWSGMPAQAYAASRSPRVAKLVLLGAFSSVAEIHDTLARIRSSISPEIQIVHGRCSDAGSCADSDEQAAKYQAAPEAAAACLAGYVSKVACDVYRAPWGDDSELTVACSFMESMGLPLDKLERRASRCGQHRSERDTDCGNGRQERVAVFAEPPSSPEQRFLKQLLGTARLG